MCILSDGKNGNTGTTSNNNTTMSCHPLILCTGQLNAFC